MSLGAKKDDQSTGRMQAAEFHHVMARSHMVGIFKTYEQFIS
jgi:hypothetical protein